MKLFVCSSCELIVHFENSQCTRCGHTLAYLADHALLTALEPVKDSGGLWEALAPGAKGQRYRLCGNQIDHAACNWAIPESDPDRFCRSCRLNEIIPNLSDPKARDAWIKLEQRKRRMLYTLLELGLPVESRTERPNGLAFVFKQDQPGDEKVMIGHDLGRITINIAEADSPFREKTRIGLGESYRTVLGHFRHEIGHYYWDRPYRRPTGRRAAWARRFLQAPRLSRAIGLKASMVSAHDLACLSPLEGERQPSRRAPA